jgi:hypothetical protein
MRSTHGGGAHSGTVTNEAKALEPFGCEFDGSPVDVFKEDVRRSDFSNDSDDVREEVDCDDSTAARSAERRTRPARRDDIHKSTPRAAIEGRDIVPDRSRIQGLVRHPRHEDGRCVGVPLDVTHSSVSPSQGLPESELQAPDPGT